MGFLAVSRRITYSLPAVLLVAHVTSGALADSPNAAQNVRIVGQGGDSTVPLQIPADQVVFTPAPGRPGISHARYVGDTTQPGMYVTIVKMLKGATTPPHFHPDGRFTTVLRGKVMFGIGDKIDPATAKVFEAGSVYYTPPNTPHYLVSMSRELVYQEVGIGPSGSTQVGPK